ncbi:MAG: glutamate-5-semialdehyde dehydrogenase [Cyanobacteria bacterium P01_H01_bin.74]
MATQENFETGTAPDTHSGSHSGSNLALLETGLQQSKKAAGQMTLLTAEQKNAALAGLAKLIDENRTSLLEANQADLQAAKESGLSKALFNRLKLDDNKLTQVVQGINDLMQLPDPTNQVLSRTELDTDLVLEKQSVALGLVGIIFESRPDVLPQVVSLIIKSGNAVVLKGGQESSQSNLAMMTLIKKLTEQLDFLPEGWALLLDSREAVHQMLYYPQYIDLIIPRGSNQLVQTIMANTAIPVLGHADGVCHIYIHDSADIVDALAVVIDAKTQYPAACNAVETLLIDESIAESFLIGFWEVCASTGIALRGCKQSQQILADDGKSIDLASDEDWHTEYGNLTLAVKVVSGVEEAIGHINQYGSHHTDAILSAEKPVIEQFLNAVDSACVFANASTRFADGFRFGFGAEVGISTAKIHARGPVGLEGLVTYKYKLRGKNQVVNDYTGSNAKTFSHKPLTL